MVSVTNWDKFKLLLWKNWILQWNQKWQLLLELILPSAFSLLLVLFRILVDTEPVPATYYQPQSIDNLDLFIKSLNNKLGNSKQINFTLGYAPENAILKGIVQEAATSLQLKGIQGYSDAATMQYHLETGAHITGVQFNDKWGNITDYPKDFSFALRFPSELRTVAVAYPLNWMTRKLFLEINVPGPRNPTSEDGGIPVGYLREGFLPIQHAISMAYMKILTNNSELPAVYMQRFPYPAFNSDPLLEGLSTMMSLIILLSFIYPCTYIVKYITAEKEKQLKEVMKIMGLNNWIHWTAWFVKSFIMLSFSAVLITVFLKVRWSGDVAVLTHGGWTVLLFFMLIYTISSICFCFMLATLFSKASTAAAVTGLVWFIAYMPFSFTIRTYGDLTLAGKLSRCLLSNTGMGFAFKLIIDFEGKGEGLQWSNLFQPVNVDDSLTVGYIIIMMLISSVIYMGICLYVEQIYPGEFGVPKKWNFIFAKQFWCNERDYIGVEDIPNGHLELQNPEAFEPERIHKHVGIQVKNLKKRFGHKVAVKNLSINMYEDEITVLLGHNGAGKTTTISMLTGMFPPTAGTAIINGSDIRTNIEGARMSLGICPQHNVLFDDLTVSEHLIFFSRLKGLSGNDVLMEVSKYLKMIELEDKANVATKKLSGGMKRKLSVCCALAGNTKVVLCDEPSSGMDPSARRQLWDLLEKEKVGRTILLTTHFMDEADVLGDRIAIMCDGELKCYGTSFFLKKKYGSGYKLICVKREDCESKVVTNLLQNYIPGLQPNAEIGAELLYELPDHFSSKFEEMLRSLEQHSDNLKLNGYGIGITSLEEVFMKVGAEDANDGTRKACSAIMNGSSGYADEDSESITSERLFSENKRLLKGFKLLSNQWHAMILKKLLYTYRNKLMFLIQNVMPIFFVSVTILTARDRGVFMELPAMTVSLTQYPYAVAVLDVDANVMQDSLQHKIADKYKSVATSYGSNYEFFDTGNKSFTNYILKLGEEMQVRINSKYLAAASIHTQNITAWLNNQPLHTAPLTVNLVHNAMLRALTDDSYKITVTNDPLPYTSETRLTLLNLGNNLGTQLAMNLCFCFCFVSAFYILFLIKERETRSKLLQFVGGVKVWTFWLSQFVWDLLTFTFTTFIVIACIACWQENGFSTFPDLGRYFSVIIIFGCAALPFTYLISFFFVEPATGFARISIINIFSGMALFIVIIVMSIEVFDTKHTADLLSWFFRLFPHFSLAMSLNKLYMNVAKRDTCNSGVISALPDGLRCQLIPLCCNTVPYFAWEEPGILPEIIYMIATAVAYILIVVTNEYGIVNELIYKLRKLTYKPPPPPEDGYFDEDVEKERQQILNMRPYDIEQTNLVLDRITKYYGKFLAVNQVSLCVKPVECFGLLGVNGAGKTSTFKMMTGDERITFGSAYVKGLSLTSNMNKVYKDIGYCPQFDALLEDLTGRETLKIFCLLKGIRNQRVKHITEELAKSFGFMKHLDKPTKAYSGGNKRKLSTAIAVIGSPSVIYLDEPTTGMDPAARRQLWNMVCRIRDSGKSIVLTSHSMEECEALCTRLAIMVNGEFKCIGSTQHLKNKFSKGLVLKIKVKRSAEVLRDRTSFILAGSECSVTDQAFQQDIQNIKLFVEREFFQAILQEEYQGILTFYIPLTSIKWSKIFGLMESNRLELNIEDYSVSQTTLEEIFLDFAKYQREDPRLCKDSRSCGCISCFNCLGTDNNS